MDSIKILDNIEPFNELFYKNCFYNSLIPIIKHFHKEALPIFVNDIAVYSNNVKNEVSEFTMSYSPQKSLEDVLDTIGINVEEHNYTQNILDNITSSISKDNPVIIFVDPFYEPFRRDAYNKKHLMHTLLVYGYDKRECLMNIVEHKDSDTLSYEKRTIGYTDIKNSYYGYCNYFLSNNEIGSFYEFEIKKSLANISNIDYKNVYVQNFIEKEEELLEGLEKLRIFNKKFEELVSNEMLLRKVLDTFISSLNSIINAKQVEIYRILKLYGENSSFLKLQIECMELWSLVRAVIVKYKLSGVYKREKFIALVDKLKVIYNIEYSYYEAMMLLGK